jgi:hypothetical protein
MISYFQERPEAVGCFAGVAPTSSFHLVRLESGGQVESIRHIKEAGCGSTAGSSSSAARSSTT